MTTPTKPNPVASVTTGWGQIKPRHELKLRSGNVVLVQELDLADVMATGVMDHLDAFTQELAPKEKAAAKKAGISEEDAVSAKFLKDSERMAKVIKMMDKVISIGVVDPVVTLHKDGDPLDPDKIYSHLIPLDDRIEIFEAVIPDLSDTFPDSEGPGNDVATLANGEGL